MCFLYYHIGLCEISENFSWQTIWDLSEELQLQEIYRSEEKTRFVKITQFRNNIANIPRIFAYIDIFLTFVFFVQSQWALRDPRKIFLTNNLRLVREVPAPRNLQIWGENQIYENRLFSWQYSLYFSHFACILTDFWILCVL